MAIPFGCGIVSGCHHEYMKDFVFLMGMLMLRGAIGFLLVSILFERNYR
jgi:hypothetical protein